MKPASSIRSSVAAACGLALLLALASGCATRRGAKSTAFHDEQMDFSLVRVVAVLPFENLSGIQPADERVRETFMTSLQSVGALYVVPPGEVARGIDRVNLRDPTNPSAEDIVALCKAVEADAIFTGTLLEYGEARSGSATANVVSLNMKLFEGETGRVVWSAATSRGGIGTKERLFGGGGRAMSEVTLEAVRDLIKRLFE